MWGCGALPKALSEIPLPNSDQLCISETSRHIQTWVWILYILILRIAFCHCSIKCNDEIHWISIVHNADKQLPPICLSIIVTKLCNWFQEQLSASLCTESNTTKWETSGKDHQCGWICQKGVFSHPQQRPCGQSHHSKVLLPCIIKYCTLLSIGLQHVFVYCSHIWSGCLEVWPLSSQKGRMLTTVFAKVWTLMTT